MSCSWLALMLKLLLGWCITIMGWSFFFEGGNLVWWVCIVGKSWTKWGVLDRVFSKLLTNHRWHLDFVLSYKNNSFTNENCYNFRQMVIILHDLPLSNRISKCTEQCFCNIGYPANRARKIFTQYCRWKLQLRFHRLPHIFNICWIYCFPNTKNQQLCLANRSVNATPMWIARLAASNLEFHNI